MSIDRSKRITFEETADLYDEARSGYPDDLIDALLDYAGLAPGSRILEIGPGTGNATVAFGRRGCRLLGIELGARLAACAAANCRDFPGVQILNLAFEDWPVEEAAFGLATAFDALHWIPPELAYPKIARALKPGGTLAPVFRVPSFEDTELARAIDRVYREHAPRLVNPERRFDAEWVIGVVGDAIRLSGLFGEITTRQFFWPESQSGEQYVHGLWTYSDHHGLDPGFRKRLYARLRAVIRRFGDRVERQASAVLFLTRTGS